MTSQLLMFGTPPGDPVTPGRPLSGTSTSSSASSASRSTWPEWRRDAYEERAGIIEFGCRVSREVAEAQAFEWARKLPETRGEK